MSVISWFRTFWRNGSNGAPAVPRTDGGGDGRSREGEALLAKEETVVRLLEEHAGVTWQSHIVAETGWADSTVSRKLSALEADGTIRRERIGNRNLVSLPGTEPTSLKRAYDPSSE